MAEKIATVAQLLAPTQAETRMVELGSGMCVEVRGLTRAELLDNGKGVADGDNSEIEIRNIASCLVRPAMTQAQVRTWREQPGSVPDVAKVTNAIRDLSGLGKGAAKSDLDSDGDGA